jgi:hypothetical protein
VGVGADVVTIFDSNGQRITNSNADHYYKGEDEGGYGCKTAQEVADKYHANFCPKHKKKD